MARRRDVPADSKRPRGRPPKHHLPALPRPKRPPGRPKRATPYVPPATQRCRVCQQDKDTLTQFHRIRERYYRRTCRACWNRHARDRDNTALWSWQAILRWYEEVRTEIADRREKRVRGYERIMTPCVLCGEVGDARPVFATYDASERPRYACRRCLRQPRRVVSPVDRAVIRALHAQYELPADQVAALLTASL
jgi:hypothetical protein